MAWLPHNFGNVYPVKLLQQFTMDQTCKLWTWNTHYRHPSIDTKMRHQGVIKPAYASNQLLDGATCGLGRIERHWMAQVFGKRFMEEESLATTWARFQTTENKHEVCLTLFSQVAFPSDIFLKRSVTISSTTAAWLVAASLPVSL